MVLKDILVTSSLRLLADDLTGALDTAAEFVGMCGPIDVVSGWALPSQIPQSVAIDSETRECSKIESLAAVDRLAPLLRDGDLAYKKIDSLLRGFWAAELGACLRSGHWRSCILAPAFAYQGRRTFDGQQYARAHDGSWSRVGDTLLAQLEREGVTASRGRLAGGPKSGLSVFDAENEVDLDRVVDIGKRAPGPVLWCGSGGLAGALARDNEAPSSRGMRHPILGVFGSDHPTTIAQLAACKSVVTMLSENDASNADIVRNKLATDVVVMVAFDLPGGLGRLDAAKRIACELERLTVDLEPPGTLIVAGGETLKAVCLAVEARALKVTGRVFPGLPRSTIQGGRWDGVDVISKSGAFGPPDMWRELLSDNGLVIER
jgi:uncharacterized protein YgbK (DUF1537 family)